MIVIALREYSNVHRHNDSSEGTGTYEGSPVSALYGYPGTTNLGYWISCDSVQTQGLDVEDL